MFPRSYSGNHIRRQQKQWTFSATVRANVVDMGIYDIQGLGNTHIDWGDGTATDTYIGTSRTQFGHVYSTPGVKTVTITANNPIGNVIVLLNPPTRGRLASVSPFPAWPIVNIDFMFTSSPITNYPADLFAYCGETVLTAQNTFSSAKLTTVPTGLLAPLVNITTMESMFSGCTSLTTIQESALGSHPYLQNMTSFCYNARVLASIPATLLAQCPNLQTVADMFSTCWALPTIPQGFFRSNRKISNFSEVARYCKKLVLNPYIFYNEGEQATRFADVVTPIDFASAFETSTFTGSSPGVAPDLWNCVFPQPASSNYCYSSPDLNARFSNAADIPVAWYDAE